MSDMRAMVLDHPGAPLRLETRAIPKPGPGEVLIEVAACAVCRTDLHVVDGDLPPKRSPVIPGHEIIGRVAAIGPDMGVPDGSASAVAALTVGDRVGVPWLGHTCGACRYCRRGDENLCAHARFTGYTLDGGFASHTIADARYVFPIPERYTDVEAAPLMCAGLIGYRAYRMTGDARRIGLYGFGAAAHILTQLARYEDREVYAFTRPGDEAAQDFARALGATWAGGSDERAPEPLDAAILFAPIGALVPIALKAVDKGGTVVTAGIHMSDIPSFPYKHLWEERTLRSVANLTRADGEAFLKIAPKVPIQTKTHTYALTAANEALDDLRAGRFEGAAVLVMD